jgi:predicted enzyme related to lactoylglutathione lyase
MNKGDEMAEAKTVLYPTRALAESKRLFTDLLGTEPIADAPYYVGYQVGDTQIGLVPNGHDQGWTGSVCFFDVDDIEATIANATGNGASVLQAPTNVGGGLLTALLKDAEGNIIGLRQTTAGN